jgi:hypothetical protein
MRVTSRRGDVAVIPVATCGHPPGQMSAAVRGQIGENPVGSTGVFCPPCYQTSPWARLSVHWCLVHARPDRVSRKDLPWR